MAGIDEGTVIDNRYKVLSRLGSGGMAEVFLAEDGQLGRKVALKLLHRRFAEDPDFVERFRREAQSAAGLQHPNVVSVYDRGTFDGTYYIAMEYLPGPSLKELIRREAPLDPLRAIDITLQILKAARFAHRRGVIHRDLKPHNVLIDDGDHAKVTDFGIARAGASDMTETGSIMGTAQYLSPEQAQGHAVNQTSDLYSVGVILYEMLTGRVPFEAESAVTIAIKHVSEPPTPPRQINPAIPPELEQIVLWTLNKNPADRPPDADALIAALESARELIASGARGERTASFAAVPVVPVDEAVVVEEEDRRRWWPWALVALLVLLLAGGALAYLLTRSSDKVVPTVVGEKVDVAQTQVQNAGFTPNLISRADKAPSGTVIAQNPLGDTKAPSGSTVTLTVSSGLGNVSIPSVANLTQAQAQRALAGAHLKISNLVAETSANVIQGNAIRTDPAAGQSVPFGSGVTLFVSSGKPQKAVPDVTGQPQASAESTLRGDGFAVATTSAESSTVPVGNVISQSPTGNTQAAEGSTVSLVIAKAPTTAKVPAVTGDTQNGATNALTTAGFTVTVKTQTVSQQSQNGIVLSQSPAGNATAKKGSQVTIVVGRVSTTTTTSTTTSPTSTTTTTSTHP